MIILEICIILLVDIMKFRLSKSPNIYVIFAKKHNYANEAEFNKIFMFCAVFVVMLK